MKMEEPTQILNDIVKRISEIIWWNRGLTKLDNPKYFKNYKEFIERKLIDLKGPYLEFILPPKLHDLNTRELLLNLDFNENVIQSIIEILFKGKNLFLYEHQAQAIKEIVEYKKDIILSVPTATGKTEAFLIPILDYCVKTRIGGLKALIIYPMKTLEVDQLNRFITYLYEINNAIEDGFSIKIGIWDGDTPNQVGDPSFNLGFIPSDSYYRGLICPICKNKLRINPSGFLYCEKHSSFTWIMVTRENISNNNVDILITNPESLDFLTISPRVDRKKVIGSYTSQYPLKYIVFDEIHTWTGLSGAAIKLFMQRLKKFYKNTNPQLILLSATLKNPDKLINAFTDSNNYTTINFKPITIDTIGESDFKRLSFCNFKNLIWFLCSLQYKSNSLNKLNDEIPDVYNIHKILKILGIIEISNGNQVKIQDQEFYSFLKINSLKTIQDSNEFDNFVSELLENYSFKKKWRELLISNMPEIINLINFIEVTSENPVKFVELNKLIEYVKNFGLTEEKARNIISMCLNFGRIADLLSDRYHLFLKPRENLYWCKNCSLLLEKEVCECGSNVKTLRFCRNCHEVFYEEINLEQNDISKEIKYPHSIKLKNCPNCGKGLNLYSIGVPYTSFISFLISAVCRRLESKKILIFSDGRGSAEKIGSNIIENDYNLVAEQLLLDLLLKSQGYKNSREIYSELISKLNKSYYSIFKDESLDSISEDIIEENRKQYILPLANISNMFHSINDSIITVKCISDLKDNVDYILAHELFRSFTSYYRNLTFTKNKIRFLLKNKTGITMERIIERFNKKFNYPKDLIRVKIYPIFKLFVEHNIISEFTVEEIETLIQRQRSQENLIINDKKVEEVRRYINKEKEQFQQFLRESNSDYISKTGVFTRTYHDDFDVELVDQVVFCKSCYLSYPILNNDIKKCPICDSNDLFIGSRIIKINENGNIRFEGLGYLNIDSNWAYNVDHWASDTLSYALNSEGKKIQTVSIAVHRAGLPYSLRGIFEEGFRKNPPTINTISSTPTLELGVDIGSLDAISMVGIPPLLTNYVQRSGRTGRIKGNPSYIFNVIRNNHAIDNYYFSDLNSYFKDFKQIIIPEPQDFDSLFAAHVINIICTYLARNPDPKNLYFKFYRLPEGYLNIKNYYREVIRRIKLFMRLVRTEKKSELESLLRNDFGEHSITIFKRLFFNEDDDLFLLKIVNRFFGRIKDFEADQIAIKSLTETYRSLDWWLSLLGLIANYRGAGNISIPIYIPGSKSREKQIEFKELERAIRETYPGQENQQGALLRVEAARYIVDDVHGTSERLNENPIKVCVNPLCSGSFIPYTGSFEKCEYCDSKIEEFTVFGLNTVKVKSARRWGDHFETTPFTLICPQISKIKSEIQDKFFNIDARLEYGRINVIKSTLAFNKMYRTSKEPKLYYSQAFIENIELGDEEEFNFLSLDDDLSIDWDQELDRIRPQYHPIGFKFQTLGIKITMKVNDINSLVVNYYGNKLDDKAKVEDLSNNILVALFSIQQSLKKIVSIYAETNISDFEVCFTFDEENINFYLVDNREGGNGVSRRVFESLVTDHKIYHILENGVLNCEDCLHYCDNCLLIERTPEFLLKKNLLDHLLIKYIYQSGISKEFEEEQSEYASIEEEQELFLKKLIKNGEDKYLEFKSSLRWDYHQNKTNKDLEFVVAKTVSAFLNTEGGKLFIGVENEGNILGLDKDYYTLRKKNKDGFLLKIDELLNNSLGKEFSKFLNIKIIDLDKKPICIVEVSKSTKPVFIKRGNKEDFFIRGAAGTQPLGMKETINYIKLHWPDYH